MRPFIQEPENTVMIVDSFNLAFRYLHSKKIDFADDYIKTVESLKRSYKAKDVIITGDHGQSSYRLNIFPEYKANRAKLRIKDTEEDKEFFKRFFEEYLSVLEHYKYDSSYPVFRFKGVEADDIAAYICVNIDKYGYDNVWLISSDRDWDLLISKTISRFSYVTRKEYTLETWKYFYEYPQEDYISIKCLQGDSGDNIPGIRMIGPKTAAKLVTQYGNVLDIADFLPLPGTSAAIKNLNEAGPEFLQRNLELMDLKSFCTDAVGIENTRIIDKELTKP